MSEKQTVVKFLKIREIHENFSKLYGLAFDDGHLITYIFRTGIGKFLSNLISKGGFFSEGITELVRFSIFGVKSLSFL